MVVETSIFKATKVMLDIAPDDPSFDGPVLTFINSALGDLVDLGMGPVDGLTVTGDTELWADLLESPIDTDRIKTWIWLKVRLAWDPPQTSFLLEAHQKQIEEATWRLVNKRDGDRYATLHPSSEDGDILILDGGEF